ncbi:MAG: hypothetical protein LUQ31_00750 [Methanoregula sp.]|nr:hypothetical protein [Methanoregula sp.]
MTRKTCLMCLGFILVLMLLAAGCVTPPSGTTTSSSKSGGSHTTATTAAGTNSSVESYVTEVTPFGAGSSSAGGSATANPYATPTPVAADQSCLIYLNTQFYSYNTTAVTFDLKNPPMYINYTVKPANITVHKVVASRTGSKSDDVETLTYSDYAPYSWFEITVRNKTSGEILLQNGFGRQLGYGIYTNATLKPILNAEDLQVEMHGNNITATTGIWVKPVGNFDDPQNKTFAECKYWGTTRNTMPIATATTTQTWTPENEVSIAGGSG